MGLIKLIIIQLQCLYLGALQFEFFQVPAKCRLKKEKKRKCLKIGPTCDYVIGKKNLKIEIISINKFIQLRSIN